MSDGYTPPSVIRNQRQLREELSRQSQKQRSLEQDDLIVEDPRRLLLRSPNGHYWAIGVTDAGEVTATDVGAKPQ